MRRVANAFAGPSPDGVPAAGDQHGGVRRGMWLVQAEPFGRGTTQLATRRQPLVGRGCHPILQDDARHCGGLKAALAMSHEARGERVRWPLAGWGTSCRRPARRCPTRNVVGSSRALRARHHSTGNPAAAVGGSRVPPDTARRRSTPTNHVKGGRPSHHVKGRLDAQRPFTPAARRAFARGGRSSCLGWRGGP